VRRSDEDEADARGPLLTQARPERLERSRADGSCLRSGTTSTVRCLRTPRTRAAPSCRSRRCVAGAERQGERGVGADHRRHRTHPACRQRSPNFRASGRGAAAACRRRSQWKGSEHDEGSQKCSADGALQEEVGRRRWRPRRRRHGDGRGERQAGAPPRSRSIPRLSTGTTSRCSRTVLAACNEALRKSRELVQQELGNADRRSQDPGLGM